MTDNEEIVRAIFYALHEDVRSKYPADIAWQIAVELTKAVILREQNDLIKEITVAMAVLQGRLI